MNIPTTSRPPSPTLARRLRPAVAAALLCAVGWLGLPFVAAQAQEVRNFPPSAMRGRLVVTAPPQVQLNGRDELLAPGVRIRNTQNMLVMSAALAGQELRVNYTREGTTGMLQEVWILTEAEAALRRPGSERPWYTFGFGSD